LLAGLSDDEPRVDADSHRVTVPVTGAGQLAEAVRLLDEHGIGVDDIGLRRPTLDEVFLGLTGAVPTEGSADHDHQESYA
jgi:ABC-2 type transport system ATP-binding protein